MSQVFPVLLDMPVIKVTLGREGAYVLTDTNNDFYVGVKGSRLDIELGNPAGANLLDSTSLPIHPTVADIRRVSEGNYTVQNVSEGIGEIYLTGPRGKHMSVTNHPRSLLRGDFLEFFRHGPVYFGQAEDFEGLLQRMNIRNLNFRKVKGRH